MYSLEQVIDASLSYFKGAQLPADTFANKYALRRSDGIAWTDYLEATPLDMQVRVSLEFARKELELYPDDALPAQTFLAAFADTGLHPWEAVDCTWEEVLERARERAGFGAIVLQGSPLSGIGNADQIQSLSNCFVVAEPHDSYGGILLVDEQLSQIMKRRGGCGTGLDPIRPKGMLTSNAARTTDGLVPYAKRYSHTTEEVAQGGRRGALMLMLSCVHPQAEWFINMKRDKSTVSGANVSVKYTDEFMHAVVNEEEFTLRWPVTSCVENAKNTRCVQAIDVWRQTVDAAWYSAEPGVSFWSTVLKRSPSECYASKGFKTVATNPCGEIGLSAFDSCRLGIIDIRKFVKNQYLEGSWFDHELYGKYVKFAMRVMDDLVDLEIEAVDKILAKIDSDSEPDHVKRVERELWTNVRDAAVNGRRTGLGNTAIGDGIAMLDMKYGSQESIHGVEAVYKTLAVNAYRATVDLARLRGAFPAYEYELEEDHEFVRQIMDCDPQLDADYKKYGRRNIALTTTAPVGSISILLQCTSGIEPAFMATPYKRSRKINPGEDVRVDRVDEHGIKWTTYDVYEPGVEAWKRVTRNDDVTQSPYHGATTVDVDWKASVHLQAAAQKWVCHSISKTVNLPKNASHELVSEVMLEAWKTGCKGITVYRDKSRVGVLNSAVADDPDNAMSWFEDLRVSDLREMVEVYELAKESMPSPYASFIEEKVKPLLTSSSDQSVVKRRKKDRPKELPCNIHTTRIDGVSYTILVGVKDGKPYEMFCGQSDTISLPKKTVTGSIVKSDKKNAEGRSAYDLVIPFQDDVITVKDIVSTFDNPQYGSFTRSVSLHLREGTPLKKIVEQFRKDRHAVVTSFSTVIARVLSKYIPTGEIVTDGSKCPKCGGDLAYTESCMRCVSCGESAKCQ